jgi:hypothetical protein
MSRKLDVLILMVAVVSAALTARAEPTQLEVRVISKGAKFVGTSMGGVLITIRNADTGELLAEG